MDGEALMANWGPHKFPVIGSWFLNPKEEAKKQAMSQAAQAYQAYRPEMLQAQQNALRQQMALFQPLNRAIGQMYGAGSAPDLWAATQNPLGPSMQQVGRPMAYRSPEDIVGTGFGILANPLTPIGGAVAAAANRKGKR
jgi:hypothetical protein